MYVGFNSEAEKPEVGEFWGWRTLWVIVYNMCQLVTGDSEVIENTHTGKNQMKKKNVAENYYYLIRERRQFCILL